MTTATTTRTTIEKPLDASVLARVLEEGYGPGAWHGADLKAALAGVSAKDAFRRPAPGRHNIAEIALHHAWCVRNVVAQLSGPAPEPFPLEGEDWFELPSEKAMSWSAITGTLERLQRQLSGVVASDGGAMRSPKSDAERLDLVLGITCHAIYHAGQIQLVKVLLAG